MMSEQIQLVNRQEDKLSAEHTVTIPEFYLLTLAVHGNMGDGEIPDLMKNWAKRECERLNLGVELQKLQEQRRLELNQRLRNSLGDEFVDKIESTINQTITKLTSP